MLQELEKHPSEVSEEKIEFKPPNSLLSMFNQMSLGTQNILILKISSQIDQFAK
jgi:hypothetical protein